MPATVPTDPLGRIYAEWTVEFTAAPELSLPVLRWIFEDWQRATAEPEDVTYRSTEIGGVPGILVSPIGADSRKVLLVLHGGGFALGSSASHRKMAGHLAKAMGAFAFVADFRRAPEFPYPAQLDDADAVIDALIADGHRAADITPVGDSAGASIAIATVLRRLRDGAPVPAQVITISPWLDMENSGETIETNDATDFLIAREGLQGNIDRYLSGGADPTDPLVNPLYADFTGFPRLYIAASATESLYHDAVRLAERARSAGVDVVFDTVDGEQHVWPMQAGNHPAADTSVRRIADWQNESRVAADAL
ncbi:alpha/beta hydrolase fold domain-containing protein [Microbacterium sp. ASV49]|uniref:Alpha/beta hydrolase fold domain-containing protein n=1 Tax=Microbacterium candidum TaxID=3041922 RepID=A0ABT7N015_9MICO|nr:alpha/beta hydrolase fold domain-containing protein [Microbacterium sp. ASV49]MDL9980048.1 alpha/beta hydrolase fold domain-containing protein [Microbacterium sp. ASV49]